MAVYIEMPKLSDTMTEGTLVKWRKAIGDNIKIGDTVAEVETDKAVMEMEAFEEGVLREIYVKEGEKVQIGQRLAALGSEGDAPGSPTPEPKKSESAPKAEASTENPKKATEKAKETAEKIQAPQAKASSTPASQDTTARAKASPLAKKMASAKGVDIGTISGTGPGGRIVARDVETAGVKPSPASPAQPALAKEDKRIPLSGMRKIIAERLLTSKTQIPHFYLNIEVDAGELLKIRGQVNLIGEKNGQAKLTINDFVVKAAIVAATRVPKVNASFAGDFVIEYASINLAVAVAIDDGLVTPVIREAQTKSLRQISDSVKDLAARARSKKLKPEEYQGGTLTISNLGSYGIENFSAIINPPQAMILSIGAIVKKPVVNAQDQIVVGHRMNIGLSADHRVVDGAIGAQYLAELRQILENPVALLL